MIGHISRAKVNVITSSQRITVICSPSLLPDSQVCMGCLPRKQIWINVIYTNLLPLQITPHFGVYTVCIVYICIRVYIFLFTCIYIYTYINMYILYIYIEIESSIVEHIHYFWCSISHNPGLIPRKICSLSTDGHPVTIFPQAVLQQEEVPAVAEAVFSWVKTNGKKTTAEFRGSWVKENILTFGPQNHEKWRF